MENRRAVVIAGGEINSYERIRSFFMPGDYYIFCDSGLVHKEKLLVEPDLTLVTSIPMKESRLNPRLLFFLKKKMIQTLFRV